MDKRKEKVPSHIPQREIEALARRLFPAIQEYFESEQGQKEFQEWKEQKEKEIKSE
ncbi:MAG: hypothetical protein A4E56_02815 [Pelotomaculum sp. PtaU1.Bin065]|nr:MAG: hypothetical protein A4E56_02815 [Pelotomaculum sp. PtaU1.Bin065]